MNQTLNWLKLLYSNLGFPELNLFTNKSMTFCVVCVHMCESTYIHMCEGQISPLDIIPFFETLSLGPRAIIQSAKLSGQ